MPFVDRGVTEAALAAQFLDRHPSLGLFEKTDDLFSLYLLFFMSVILHDLMDFSTSD